MKTYILTSDKLVNQTVKMVDHIYPKYHPKGEVCILGYKPPITKSQIYNFKSIGVDDGPNSVCKQLFSFFNSINDEFFMIEVDDKPLLQSYNYEILDILLSKIKNNNKIGRIGLTLDNTYRRHKTIETIKLKNGSMILYKNLVGENHKLSITNSLWNKTYFLKYLNGCNNLWEWEVDMSKLSNKDDWLILGSKPSVSDFSHLFKKGRLIPTWQTSPHTRKKLDKEDIKIIKNLYNIK
tara:strand:- start:1768 stop:2478 length:711 start_codon:yes stop_codon:yes gene_type:complete